MRNPVLALLFISAAPLGLSCASEAPEAPESVGNRSEAQLVPCSEGSGAGGGGASGASAGGTSGSAGADATGGKPSGGAPFVPGPPYMAPAHQGNLIHVENRCSFPLWIHGIGGGGVLMPDDQKLDPNMSHDYTRGDWPFAYVDAFLDGPGQNRIGRAEVTFFPGSYVSYRLNYIDGIALPMELQAIGPGTDCKPIACYATQAQIMAECPEGLLSGKRCLSAGEYCKDAANAAKPFCHALDGAIAQCAASTAGCADAVGATTAQAYDCSGPFGNKPEVCAALNRGTLSNLTAGDEASFFKTAPYNGYAAWLHGICPGLSTFPYDDAHVAQDSFHTCIDAESGTQLNITFCPAG